jgi:nucleotide-binding universal stress UspA family protein
MSEHNKILVPVDYSPQSLIALEQAANLAKVFNAEITILKVAETGGVAGFFSSKHMDEFTTALEVQLKDFVAEQVKKLGVAMNAILRRGKVYDEIVETAEEIKATFIVMGTSGSESGMKRFIGSNALRVVRSSKIPVITIKGQHHRKGCQNIILPLDLTKETKEKVGKAIEFAKRFGSTVRVVSVLFTSDEFIVNRLTRQLDQVKKFIEKSAVECSAEIIKSTKGSESLAEVIIDYANKAKGDLVIIMTQQENDYTEYFIGSSAQEIINHSDIPVLSIIPSPSKDTTVFTPY